MMAEMAFRWRADDGPFIAVFGSSIPSSTKKKLSNLDPLGQNFLDPRMYGTSSDCNLIRVYSVCF